MIHVQTNVGQNIWRRLRRRPQDAAAPWGGSIFQNMFEDGPYLALPIFKIAIGLVFQNSKIHNLVGGASYHHQGAASAAAIRSWRRRLQRLHRHRQCYRKDATAS